MAEKVTVIVESSYYEGRVGITSLLSGRHTYEKGYLRLGNSERYGGNL